MQFQVPCDNCKQQDMSRVDPLKAAKSRLRKSLRSKLLAIPGSQVLSQTQDVVEVVKKTIFFTEAKKIALYMNMPNSEIQTMDLIKECFNLKKEVYLPRTEQEDNGCVRNRLRMLKVQSFESVLKLEPRGKFSLLEPVDGDDIMNEGGLDLVIVPGVAFTKDGRRLGHGAGYYDSFFESYKRKFGQLPYLLGIGFNEQLVDDIPVEKHDQYLHSVVIGGQGLFSK